MCLKPNPALVCCNWQEKRCMAVHTLCSYPFPLPTHVGNPWTCWECERHFLWMKLDEGLYWPCRVSIIHNITSYINLCVIANVQTHIHSRILHAHKSTGTHHPCTRPSTVMHLSTFQLATREEIHVTPVRGAAFVYCFNEMNPIRYAHVLAMSQFEYSHATPPKAYT